MLKKLLLVGVLCLVILMGCEQIQIPSNNNQVEPNLEIVNTTPINSTPEDIYKGYDFLHPHEDNLTFYFLDIPGTPILVTFPNNSTALINTGTGEETNRIYNYAKNLGYKDIDYLFLSNFNSYRLGGAAYIINKADISLSYDRGGAINSEYFKDYSLEVSQRIPIGKITTLEIEDVKVKLIPTGIAKDEEDYNTLIIVFEYGDFKLVHAGDCVDECEDIFDEVDINTGVLIAAKNGDCDGTTTFMLKRIVPDYIVFDDSISEVCKEAELRVKYLGIEYSKVVNGSNFFITTDGMW